MQGNLLTVTPHEIKSEKSTYLQHTMAQNIHCHSKRKEEEHNEAILNQNKMEHSRENSSFYSFLFNVQGFSEFSYLLLLPALLTETHISTLDLFHTLPTALLDRYPIALSSPTYWSLQSNPGFTLAASHNVLSDLAKLLALTNFLDLRQRFHNPPPLFFNSS